MLRQFKASEPRGRHASPHGRCDDVVPGSGEEEQLKEKDRDEDVR